MKNHFERYCKDYENIENYQKAKANDFIGWHCHHRLETHNSDGERRLVDITTAELQALGMYYHRPASELIFLTESEHKSLHKPSAEAKKKISEAKKGEKNPMYGKHHSEESKKRMREANKGKPSPNKGKHLSAEIKKKISDTLKGKPNATKGTHWYNNGKTNVMAKECPPGFVPGRLRK